MSASEPLVKIRNLQIEGLTDETRVRIINNVDLDLKRGEVLGLIGESGAGKSTLGLAAMGFTRDGCEIVGGSVEFDGVDLVGATADVKRQLLGKRIAYVAQSAAAQSDITSLCRDLHHHQLTPRNPLLRVGTARSLRCRSSSASCTICRRSSCSNARG